MTPETVTFQWRDYRHHHKRKLMTLTHDEFIRRLLLHVLPDGFQRIRHSGFLSNRQRPSQPARCRRRLGVGTTTVLAVVARLDYRQQYEQLTGQSLERCPACGQGRMTMVATIAFGSPGLLPQPRDTS
jgi:hypothetical protein